MLARWNLRDDLDSRGALLFRRFAERVLELPAGGFAAALLLGRPGQHAARAAHRGPGGAARARRRGGGAARPAAAARRAARRLQSEQRGGERIPIHGGPGTAGVFNAINVSATDLKAGQGYETVPHGSSFVQAVSVRRRAVPGACRARSSPTRSRPTSARRSSPTRRGCTRASSGTRCRSAAPTCWRRRCRRRGSPPARAACVARTALGRVSTRRVRRGRRVRVRWSGGGRATVDVLRGKRRVARLRGRGGRLTWNGRGARRDGIYVLRVRKAGDTRRLAVRRRGGKLRRLGDFERHARCARCARCRSAGRCSPSGCGSPTGWRGPRA